MKTSLAVLALIGAVSFSPSDWQASAVQLERYFPHHSWEKVNPTEFMKNLNKEVEAEKKTKQASPAHTKQSQAQGSSKRSKKDDSMIQED